MSCAVRLLALFLAGQAAVWPQDKAPAARKKLPDGVYAVQRDSLKQQEVLPLKDGEVLVVHHHRLLEKRGERTAALSRGAFSSGGHP